MQIKMPKKIEMKKPYIKKFGVVSNFIVWIVDGNYIRRYIDIEFTNFGQHHRFNFIPKNEFWIDKCYGTGAEEKYYVEHLLVEHRLMSNGEEYDSAWDQAAIIEQREREKDEILELSYKRNHTKKQILRKLRMRMMKNYSNGMRVWIVDGEIVRDLLYVGFTEGGHDKVYRFIPKNEIWIDDEVSAKERKYILLHEAYERNLMCQKLTYDEAHKNANEVEYFYRNNPEGLDKRLRWELKKGRSFLV